MAAFEDILANQQQTLSGIEQVWTNFNKDGSDRKTLEYLQRRLETLDKYWAEFQNNHFKMTEVGVESHTYFTNNEYQRARERYDYIRSHIQSLLVQERPKTPISIIKPPTFGGKSSEPQLPGPSSKSMGSASKTDENLRKQQSNFRAFHRTISNIEIDSISEQWEFDDILRTLQARWNAIDALHWDLDSELDGRNKEYEDTFSVYEKKYADIKKALNRKMSSVAHMEKYTPKMEIPSFHGNYNSWTSFKDLFTEIIHNNPTMSPAQKMQYLKSKVKGEAERLIQHLHVSSDNYNVCWDILNQRFNNKKLLFTSHINIILNLPVMQQQSLNHIKRLHDTALECLNAIKNMGVDISTWDPLVVHLLAQKLDADSYSDYIESVKQPRELPVLAEFMNFLETKFTTLESSRRKQDNQAQKPQSVAPVHHIKQKPGFYKSSFTSSAKMNPTEKVITSKYRCSFCKDNDHGIYFCRKFLDLPTSNKYKMVEALELCKNCLNKHQGKPCLSERRCRDCNKDHNSLLHAAFEQVDQTASTSAGTCTSAGSAASKSADSNTLVKSSSHVSLPNDESEVLLPTAIIKIQAADGSFKTMRALLDQGSQTSLITEHAAQVLKLSRKRCKGVISGVGDKESSCKGMIQIKCSSVVNDFTFETNAIIMKSLIKNLPSTTFAKPNWSYLDNIKLADSDFYISRPVDLLLGADVYSTLLLDGICRVDEALPIAQQTKLGWILSGHTKTLQCNVVLHNLEEIERFWQVEDISEPSDMSSEDQKCIDYYKDTTVRKEDGHYEVRVPFKPNYQEDLGVSRNKALAQFYHLEHKLNKQENISRDYKVFINEYLTLGHMIPEGNDRNKRLECYLPHHCVTRQESTTTKLRVVFNASAKTSSGLSLNDVMCRGPNLQQDLQCLVIKWRQFKFAFTADIEKMFRQIWLHEEDQMLHKIIWRDNPWEKVQVFQLATVTYGTKAAPFLAMMTLKQLAEDERANYQDSSAAEVLEQSFYMDDLIHGAHSAGAAHQLKHDLVSLLKSGGFNLRKWKSNLPELLDEKENDQDIFDFKQAESSSGKTLGLRWNPQKDGFTFKSQMEVTLQKATKRALLSEISKLFDPLGWIVPVTSKLKILFQDVWRANIEWDENVPQDLHQQWTKITADIQSIEECHVPRWLGIEEGDNIELHGFCDASTKCYACVVYCKIKRKDSESIVLVAGKAKLVPLNKIISLPRLELCSATLLAKLMSKIKQCLNSYSVTVYGWSDSMAALGWLHGEAERWKPFVANRVKQITKEIPPQSWRYVKSKENPADCASRGLTASELKKHDLWWHGPTWLPTYEATDTEPIYSTDQEQKKKTVCTTQVSSKTGVVNTLLTRTSSLVKVINIIAWVLRFVHKGKYQDYLSVTERRRARTLIIKQVQQEEFHEEITCLKANKMVKSNSKLNQLSPILDKDGVMRVGGRLRHANIDLETKHPAIIPKNTKLGDLIIDEAHECTYHGGARLTTAFTRRQYWIIGGIKTTKKRLRHCVTCRKQNPDQQYQFMGDLPAPRVNQSRPFYHTGVDYTGHVLIKANKGRGIKTTKGYVAVFVCMATKAVHLELVSDLTSSAFLAALRRMAARRGVPGHIYSDQGRNFIGADRILQQEYEELEKIINTEFLSEVASMSIEWHFNAPAWPSAGGLWESSVKSLKHHLKRVIGEQKLTFEEFSTLLSQLEGCLNSRPLVALTEDASDLDVITPSHFLASGPALNILETETDMRTRWYQTQKIFHDIWGRWQNEYLTQLSVRGKWQKPKPNIKENDIVVIRDENLPPGKWALGRVVQLHPGNDGYVRVVTLKTKNGLMQRPIVKLSILPVNKDNEEVQESSKQEDRKPSTSNRKMKTYCLATLATRLLLFFMTIIPTIEGSFRDM